VEEVADNTHPADDERPFEEFTENLEIAPESSSETWARWLLRALREMAETVIPAIVIALVINLFLAQATQVLGQSMEPNLHTAQRVVVEKVTYRFFHGPRRGDIVVIDIPSKCAEARCTSRARRSTNPGRLTWAGVVTARTLFLRCTSLSWATTVALPTTRAVLGQYRLSMLWDARGFRTGPKSTSASSNSKGAVTGPYPA